MRRILALVLAVCLLLSGCHLTINLPPKETEASRAQLDFNTLEYVRPDMEGMEALADECLELVGQDGTQTQVLELYDQILDELGNLSTMSSLASVRHDLDLQNSYYEQESLDLDAFYTKFDNRMNELTQAILDSQYAEAAVAAWGLTPKVWKNKLTARHIFTHVEWHMTGYTLEVAGDGPEEWEWVDLEGLEAHAVPSAFARYYAEAQEQMKG